MKKTCYPLSGVFQVRYGAVACDPAGDEKKRENALICEEGTERKNASEIDLSKTAGTALPALTLLKEMKTCEVGVENYVISACVPTSSEVIEKAEKTVKEKLDEAKQLAEDVKDKVEDAKNLDVAKIKSKLESEANILREKVESLKDKAQAIQGQVSKAVPSSGSVSSALSSAVSSVTSGTGAAASAATTAAGLSSSAPNVEAAKAAAKEAVKQLPEGGAKLIDSAIKPVPTPVVPLQEVKP